MPQDGEATSVAGFFALAPLLLFAVATAAAFEQTLLSLLAVYGAALGSNEERVAPLMTCFIAGNASLQILLGRLSERRGSTQTMLFCVLSSLAGCLLLFLNLSAYTLSLFFGWAAVGIIVYFAYGYKHSVLRKQNAS